MPLHAFGSLDQSLQGKQRANEITLHARRCVRERERAARGFRGPREWVLTAEFDEAARGPSMRCREIEVIEVIDFVLDFTVPPHQIRRLWRHPRPTYQSTIG